MSGKTAAAKAKAQPDSPASRGQAKNPKSSAASAANVSKVAPTAKDPKSEFLAQKSEFVSCLRKAAEAMIQEDSSSMTMLPDSYQYRGGNPGEVRAWLIATSETDPDRVRKMLCICTVMSLFGPRLVRDFQDEKMQAKAKKLDNTVKVIAGKSANAWKDEVNSREAIPGLTSNALLVSCPEIALVLTATSKGAKPLSGLLALPLRESMRVAAEVEIEAAIGQGAASAANPARDTAREMQRLKPVLELHGTDRLVTMLESVSLYLEQPVTILHDGPFAAIVGELTRDTTTFLSTHLD